MRNQPRAERRASDRFWVHARQLAASVCAALLLATLAPQPAAAQSVDDQIQRLQRELSDLQRQVYSGETPPAGASSGAGVAPTQAARIELRLNQFEDQLRDLTGRVEEMQFQADSVASRLDRLVADVDLRLQQLEQGAPAPLAAAGDPGTPSGGLSGDPGASQQGLVPSSPAATTSPAAPQTLGTIAETDLQSFQRQQGSVAANPPAAAATASPGAPAAGQALAAVPAGTPREQYDQAFALLRQANYQGAEQALSDFLVRHPDDPLAGNAKYWLGETYYVRGDYQSAAVTFAEGFEAYPDNPKAPDNLLKLGMSLASLGSKDDACGTFEVLQQRYADASATIIQRARQESQRIGC